MSDEATYSSSLGVEEIIATISVLILAGLFLGYYLWPSTPTPQLSSATIEPATGVATVASDEIQPEVKTDAVQQSISLSGKGESGSRVGVEINGAKSGQTLIDSTGNWELTTQLNQTENIEIEINASATRQASVVEESLSSESEMVKETQPEVVENSVIVEEELTSATSSIADINDAMTESVTAEPEQTLVQTAMLDPQASATQATEAETKSAPAAKGIDITEPVITFLDRDRTTNELIISGSTPETEGYVVLLINGTTTKPVKSNQHNKWRYRFKAGPGEYYVRVTPATEEGPIIQADALPTLYNISLAPVTPDSSEAGAEISLLPGEFKKMESGENLFQISQQTGIKVSDLMLVNGIVDEKAIKTGDVLFIPTGQ